MYTNFHPKKIKKESTYKTQV